MACSRETNARVGRTATLLLLPLDASSSISLLNVTESPLLLDDCESEVEAQQLRTRHQL